MRYHVHQVRAETVERVTRHGRDYLEFPIVPMREMVLNYPEHGVDEYLPADAIQQSAPAWAGVPLTHTHPPDRGIGQTARHPDAYLEEAFGQFHDPEAIRGGEKLRGRGVIDVEKANAIGGAAARTVELLEGSETVAVSAGYGTVDERQVPGEHQGNHYDAVQDGLVPDHIAVFPRDEHQARCPPESGCAAPRVNTLADTPPSRAADVAEVDDLSALGGLRTAAGDDDDDGARDLDQTTNTTMDDDTADDPETLVRRIRNLVTNAGDGDGDEDCDCGGTCDDCSHDEGASSDADGDGDGDATTADTDGGDDDDGAAPDDTHSTDDTTTDDDTMDDNDYTERVERLADDTPFDADDLAEMTDEQLDALADTGEGADTDTETTETAETTESADSGVDGGNDGDEVTVNTDAVAEKVSDQLMPQVEETIEQTVDEKVNSRSDEEVERQAGIIANATALSESGAKALADSDPEEFDRLADEHATPDQRVNFGGRPGDVNRTTDTDETPDISAGTRSDYEAQSGGDD